MRYIYLIRLNICISACLFIFLLINASAGTSITITDRNIDIYGYANNLKIGDIIKVYDTDNVLCGMFEVTKDGQYGVLHIYGDDMTSPDRDEGPAPGDALSIFVNDDQVSPTNVDELIWTKNGDLIQVDF